MKKGVIIVIILALFLCAIVTIGGGAVWYFLLRNTPKKAFTEAVTNVDEIDYYQQNQESKVTIDISIPDYPEYNMEMIMEVTGEIKIDNKDNKKYMKTVSSMEGETEITEIIYIGNDVYVKSGSSAFQKMSEEEAEKMMGSESSDVYKGLTGDTEYTVLEEGNVEGTDCYHYNVPLDSELLGDYMKNFTESFADDNVEMNDTNVNEANLEMWVSKTDSNIVKTIMRIDTISVKMNSEGVDMIMTMQDIEVTAIFSNWGEKVEIEAPI